MRGPAGGKAGGQAVRVGGGAMRPVRGGYGRWRRAGLLALALPAGCGGDAARAESEGAACEEALRVAPLPAGLEEASGIARDPRRPDVFWLHNDSDNDLVVFAVDTTGALLAAYDVSGTPNVDAEDIALGRCGAAYCLYLADIGDNFGRRAQVQVHRLPLPPLPADGRGAGEPVTRAGGARDRGPSAGPLRGTVAVERTLRLRYPDGARDAEGLAVDDARGQLLIVSKGREGTAVLYAAPLDPGGEGPAELSRIGRLPVPLGLNTGQLLTAADLSADGRQLAVRSYTTVYLFPWRGASAFDSTEAPAESPLVGAAEPQGEGLSFGEGSETLFLASESRGGRSAQLSRVVCPRQGL